MIAKIKIQCNVLKEILDSLNDISKISETSGSTDLNIFIEKNNIKIYTIFLNHIVAIHELRNENDIEIVIYKEGKIAFDSSTLIKIINRIQRGKINLELFSDRYKVSCRGDKFFDPITFELRRFTESQFQELIDIQGMKKIISLNRLNFFKALDVMSPVSNVVGIKIEGDYLYLFVSDKVEGEGNLKMKLKGLKSRKFSAFYELTPLRNFLGNLSSNNVDLYVNDNKVLMIKLKSPGIDSSLYLSSQVDIN